MFNAEKHLLESMLHPGHVIFEGYNKNLIVNKESDKTNVKFSYESSQHGWKNDFTGNFMIADALEAGANVETVAFNDTLPGQKWYFEYCI